MQTLGKLDVFVSSEMKKLAAHRRAAKQGILSLLQNPILFEDMPAYSNSPMSLALRLVESCDIYIILVGDEITAPTWREYLRAQGFNKDTLVFIQSRGKRTKRTKTLLDSILTRRHTYATFKSPSDLRKRVSAALAFRLAESYRRVAGKKP